MQAKTNQLLYLSQAEVIKVGITMREIIDAMEVMFHAKGEGRTEMPPKPGIHPGGENFAHAMPAYIPDLKSAGIKWVSGFPDNPSKVLAYDLNTSAQQAFAADITARFDLEVLPVQSPREAVSGCDIVVTAGPMTKSPMPRFRPAGWTKVPSHPW